MTRAAAKTATKPAPGPARDWPPTCPRCGAQGEPTADWSPYLYCGTDPDLHWRDGAPPDREG